jgi:hypothetical protein
LKKLSPSFAVATCGVVALLSLWNIKDYYKQTEVYVVPRDPYGVALQQQRLQDVISNLPAVRVVGYFREPGFDPFPGSGRQLAAQYAVAPRMLVPQARAPQDWVLGDFARAMDRSGFALANGVHVVKVFPNDVVLFQRNGAQ